LFFRAGRGNGEMDITHLPRRIQLSRRKGWRMPDNTVKVDRSTKWGNPFVPGREDPFETGQIVRDRHDAWLRFLRHASRDATLLAAARAELRGKNLACWCTPPGPGEPDICHAAILLVLANDGNPAKALRALST